MGGVMNDSGFTAPVQQTAPSSNSTPLGDSPTPVMEDTQITPSQSEPATKQEPDIEAIKSSLYEIKDKVESLLRTLGGGSTVRISNTVSPASPVQSVPQTNYNGEQIMEGVFNGESFVSPEGKEYPVPPNYASKSKLVEGDLMKLTITRSGTFMYKQIGPVERRRVIGSLSFDEATQKWFAQAHGKSYKILTASVTFYKGKPGDQVVILVPESGHSDWGAVENIMSM